MILLLGATGYFGQAFASELRRRGHCFIPLSRRAFEYTHFELLFDYVRRMKPAFLINTAGYVGRPNMEACELGREEALQANSFLAQTVARVCVMTNTPWGHVSSGSIYCGAKVFENGGMRVERDLNRPGVRQIFEAHPEKFFGFTEQDEPNVTFRHFPCSFFSGTKALAEETIRGNGQIYIWRLNTPFNERDEPCNLLSQLQRDAKVYDNLSSLSHLEDCVRACLDLWERGAAFGTYNVTDRGAVTTRQVVEMIERILKPRRSFEYWMDDDVYRDAAKTPRSSCILDVSKLLRAGVKMRNVEEALEDSLERWQHAVKVSPRAASPQPVARFSLSR